MARTTRQGALTSKGMNALMACANNLDMPIEDWTVGGVPITMMCHMERRKVSFEFRVGASVFRCFCTDPCHRAGWSRVCL